MGTQHVRTGPRLVRVIYLYLWSYLLILSTVCVCQLKLPNTCLKNMFCFLNMFYVTYEHLCRGEDLFRKKYWQAQMMMRLELPDTVAIWKLKFRLERLCQHPTSRLSFVFVLSSTQMRRTCIVIILHTTREITQLIGHPNSKYVSSCQKPRPVSLKTCALINDRKRVKLPYPRAMKYWHKCFWKAKQMDKCEKYENNNGGSKIVIPWSK